MEKKTRKREKGSDDSEKEGVGLKGKEQYT